MIITQLLLYAWVWCFLSYALSRTNEHSALWWNLGLKSPQTTLKFDLKLRWRARGSPFPFPISMSCITPPAPYIGLFLVPTNSWNIVEPSFPAYNFGPCTNISDTLLDTAIYSITIRLLLNESKTLMTVLWRSYSIIVFVSNELSNQQLYVHRH